MKLVIVTGMSGAGKTSALKMLEDMGFYCVDNLPIPLVEKFAGLVFDSQGQIKNAALGIDIRSGHELSQLDRVFGGWARAQAPYEILFLNAGSETLIKRYQESRRAHPLAGGGRIEESIGEERRELAFLKEEADYIIDTSKLLTRDLKQELEKIFLDHEAYHNLFVTVLSFGFKYGIPADADLIFDVRFLPNPFYAEELRPLTGEEKPVRDFVMRNGSAAVFLDKLKDLLDFLLPNYVLEGKNQLVIAIGCTGGKHRSVTVSNAIFNQLKCHEELGLKLEHRDMYRDNFRKKD